MTVSAVGKHIGPVALALDMKTIMVFVTIAAILATSFEVNKQSVGQVTRAAGLSVITQSPIATTTLRNWA